MLGIVKVLALASWLGLSPPPEISSHCARPCRLSDWGLASIRNDEGYSPFIYKDVAGLPTIGFGHLIQPGEKFKEPLMQQEAEELFKRDVRPTEKGVNRLAVVPLKQCQFDALGGFTYNLGVGALQRSSKLLPAVNAQRHKDVPPAIMEFNKARDPKTKKLVPVKGLTNRREREAKLYCCQ